MIQHPLLADISGVRHGFFTRTGGQSRGIYASRNVGLGSKDDRGAVLANRQACMTLLYRENPPDLAACYQVHSTDVVVVGEHGLTEPPKADAMVTRSTGIALGVLSADCAPILFADSEQSVIGAAHSGWKGALGGIAEATIGAMIELGAKRETIHAVIGPCITQASYQVGPEYRERFVEASPDNADFFVADSESGKFRFDLPGFLLSRLENTGIGKWAFEGSDTLTDEARFFSYRRSVLTGESDYGRGLSAITLV